MLSALSHFGVQDCNDDGVIDAIRSRIYVADDAAPEELAAAANLAARLAFETVFMDLPVGFRISAQRPGEGVAILVGRASTHAAPGTIPLPDIQHCESLSRSLGLESYAPAGETRMRAPSKLTLGGLHQSRHVLLGPEVRSSAVIDLAARIGLESTQLRLPLVRVADEIVDESSPPDDAILVGLSNPYVTRLIRAGKFSPPAAGTGCLAMVESCVVIAGANAEAEEAALRHAALCMPYLWQYGKGRASIHSIENEIRDYCPDRSPVPELIFEEDYVLAWEVEEARERIRQSLLSRIEPGSSVDVELRLSEPSEVRQRLRSEILALLEKAGANLQASSVRVWSAHKQGFCWIDEELKPKLRSSGRVRIHVRELECKTDSVDTADRWLHELYPVDEVLSRDLQIPVDCITFERAPASSKHVYEVIGEDSEGRVVVQSSFDPTFVSRPLFDTFPAYSSATVATGWIRASVNGNAVLDERIATDYERFWDRYQATTLPRIQDYVLSLHGGKPQPESAPLFDELVIEIQLSEPDHRIGIDEERISTLEALHEDIYFETLLFFEVLGKTTCGKPLRYPGRIIPRIHPSRAGAGRAKVRFTGYRSPYPHERPFANQSPTVTALTVNSAAQVTSVEILAGTRFSWLLSSSADTPDIEHRSPPVPIVQWNEPIGPEECERIIGTLASFREVRPFRAGRSWLGRTVWAMDVTAAGEGKYFSQAKAAATKPCLFITGRQHANEVSSTSHILKLVELLATEPKYRELLRRVNFIIQPITNPDGAALVDELHRLTPEFMLHAGYLGALGVDVTDEQWSNAPRYPEARIRVDLWRMWQPDIVLNPHGYPSHEWVQLFAGYTAWVKSKEVHARDWWIPRGWFIPRFDFIEDERFPVHRRAASSIKDRVAGAVARTFGAFNERMYRRYAKYNRCVLDLHNGVLIQGPACGLKPDQRAFGFMARHPEVTFLENLSEAPDEVASGNWLQSLAATGLEVSLVFANFLAELPSRVVRTRTEESGTTVLRISRTRLASDDNRL
jgi:hypothetical protein